MASSRDKDRDEFIKANDHLFPKYQYRDGGMYVVMNNLSEELERRNYPLLKVPIAVCQTFNRAKNFWQARGSNGVFIDNKEDGLPYPKAIPTK